MAKELTNAPEVMRPVWDALFDTNACPSRQRGHFAAKVALDAIPDGWAKLNGEWVEIGRDLDNAGDLHEVRED